MRPLPPSVVGGDDHRIDGPVLVEVLDIFDKMKVVGPRACFSDRGLSHRTFDQVIDTKFGSVVGPRS